MISFTGTMARLQELLHAADSEYTLHEFVKKAMVLCLSLSLVAFAAGTFASSLETGIMAMLAALIVMPFVVAASLVMRANKRTAQIEDMLPNFLSIMASNIRSGVTYDRALMLSSRKEFGPLAKEIDRAAKQTIAGKPLDKALLSMAKASRSEMFAKTMRLVAEGMNAGGNLAEMLEITAIDIRKSSSLKRDVTATVTVYRLFIFMAANVGAPLLYALTGFLIGIFSGIKENAAATSGAAADAHLLMFSGGSTLSAEMFSVYAIIAIGMTTSLSALASGVITKGKESEGLPELGWSMVLAYLIFFGVRMLFSSLLSGIMQPG